MTELDFTKYIALAAVASAYATEVLKSPAIPVPAKEHPRLTAAVVAGFFSAAAVLAQNPGLTLDNLSTWVSLTVSSFVVSAVTYHLVLKQRESTPQE